MTAAARAWAGVAALLAIGTLIAWWLPSPLLDWQPALAAQQPWRCWTAAFVHWSEWHLVGNLIGTVLLALLGVAAELPRGFAWAWLAAWPLTHLGLLTQPALAHYGGLSGVLHAGAAVVALALCLGRGRRRWAGAALGLGLLVKIGFERPWLGPLQVPQGWEIALAPAAHASGALAGVLCAGLAALVALSCGPASRPPPETSP